MNKLFFVIPFALCLLAGCGYESIFDGRDKDVLAPIDSSVLLGDGNVDFFLSEDFTSVLGPAVFKAFMDEDQIADGVVDYAVVLNETHYLRDVITEDGREFTWPNIDFDRYSLVVGRWMDAGTTWYVKDHRAKKTLFGKVTVFLHFVKHDGGAYTFPHFVFWGALYPKLPSGPAEVVCWKDEK